MFHTNTHRNPVATQHNVRRESVQNPNNKNNTVVYSGAYKILTTRNLNIPGSGPSGFLFGHGDSKHPVIHNGLDLIKFSVLRQPKPPRELAGDALNAVPRVGRLLQLPPPLPADMEDPSFLHRHLHFLLPQPRNVGPEHVGCRSLHPVDPGLSKRGRLRWEPGVRAQFRVRAERKTLKWVPDLERGRIEEIGSATEDVPNHRHFCSLRKLKFFFFFFLEIYRLLDEDGPTKIYVLSLQNYRG